MKPALIAAGILAWFLIIASWDACRRRRELARATAKSEADRIRREVIERDMARFGVPRVEDKALPCFGGPMDGHQMPGWMADDFAKEGAVTFHGEPVPGHYAFCAQHQRFEWRQGRTVA